MVKTTCRLGQDKAAKFETKRVRLLSELCVVLSQGGGGGGRGAGDREKRGRKVYGRREKRGREAGFPTWREAGEIGKNYPTLHNILRLKKCKEGGAKKYRAGTGIKGYGKREV